TDRRHDARDRLGLRHVAAQERRALERLDLVEVHADDDPVGARELDGDLAPTAGRRSEVDDARALEDDLVLLVELKELVRRAAAPALLLGELVPRVLAALAEPLPRHARSGLRGPG